MENSTAWLLFIIFGLILFVMYIAIRRHRMPIVVAAVGVLASVVVMTLNGLAQNNTIYQAIFVGLLVGGLFSGGVLAMAMYFQTNEARKQAVELPPTNEESSGE